MPSYRAQDSRLREPFFVMRMTTFRRELTFDTAHGAWATPDPGRWRSAKQPFKLKGNACLVLRQQTKGFLNRATCLQIRMHQRLPPEVEDGMRKAAAASESTPADTHGSMRSELLRLRSYRVTPGNSGNQASRRMVQSS